MSPRYRVVKPGPYPHFVTCTIVRWLPVFVDGRYCRVNIDSLQYLRQNRGLLVHAYTLMPTHLHAIVTAQNDDLSFLMRDFKKFTSRKIHELAVEQNNKLLMWMFEQAAKKEKQDSRFKVWQDEFHPKVISEMGMFVQKAEYMHGNPVRKELVADAEKWLYSSAADYAGLGYGPLEIDLADW